MKLPRQSLAGFGIAMFVVGALFSSSASATPLQPEPKVPGEVIVRYATGTSAGERSAARTVADVSLSERLMLPRTELLDTDPGQSVSEAIDDLDANPNVLYAEPNFLDRVDLTPDDPLFGNLWGLNNQGQSIIGPFGSFSGNAGADIEALTGWETGHTSANTLTAVIDSGIMALHPDLQDQIWKKPSEVAGNGLDDDGNGFVDDTQGWDFVNWDAEPSDGNGHGTHVAGTVGARGGNGLGVTGVSWDAKLLPLKACSVMGSCAISDEINAITYAAAAGARVANMSFGGSTFSQARRDAIAAASGVLFVASAGNDGTNNDASPKYPCQDDQAPSNAPLPNLICVASSTPTDGKVASSNFGLGSVDLAAPGERIESTWPTMDTILNDGFEADNLKWDWRDFATSPGSGVWERQPGIGRSGSFGVADSINSAGQDVVYAPSTTTTMTSARIDLGGRSGCGLRYRYMLDTQPVIGGDLTTGDVLYVEAKNQDDSSWVTLDTRSGSTGGSYLYSADEGSRATLEQLDPNQPVIIRFRFVANDSPDIGLTGVRIDDATILCASPSASSGVYNFLTGTSMAAPHVAGIASIVRELNPGISPTEAKQAILAGAEPVPAFSTGGSTPVVTGGRANLARTLAGLDLTPPPVPKLIGPAPGASLKDPFPVFTWKAEDPGAIYRISIDGELRAAGTGLDRYQSESTFAQGVHAWQVEAVDYPGNVAKSELRKFLYPFDGQLRIRSKRPLKDRRGGALLKVAVSGPGRLKATVKARVRPGRKPVVVAASSVKAPRVGLVKVKLRPNAKARKGLANRRSLVGKLRVRFVPADGGRPASAKGSVKLAAPRRGSR